MSERKARLSRRRRVITALELGVAGQESSSTRQQGAFRKPRQPVAYGARVHRRLRTRWFELVPVKRRTLFAVKAAVILVVALLGIGHYLSISWARLYEVPELSRPLRLDNPAGFGGWVGSSMMGLAAGISFLIYQLRRYRADDYRGQYRVWRPVIALLLILSIDSIVGMLDWTGAMIDSFVAGKAPLAGGDWLRLVLCIAGFALTIRLVIEMRRSPLAVAWLVLGSLAVASRLPIRWGLFEPEPFLGSMIQGVVPLLGRAAVLMSLITFLRMVYREVRGLDLNREGQLRSRLPRFGRTRIGSAGESTRRSAKPTQAPAAATSDLDEEPRRRWFWRASPSDDLGDDDVSSRAGWFTRWRGRAESDSSDDDCDKNTSDNSSDEARPRLSWFRRRRRPEEGTVETLERGAQHQSADQSPATDQSSDDVPQDSPPRSRSLLGWMRRKSENIIDAPAEGDSSADRESHTDSDGEETGTSNADDVDWASMSKAERRRMKKLMRRQNKQAA